MIEYLIPESTVEALEMLQRADGKARILAGGTDLLPELRRGILHPRQLIDITRISDLRSIEVEAETARVGAAVTFAEIRNHPRLQQQASALTQAAASIGAGGIQQTATWGGNLVQAMPAADGAIAALALEVEARIIGPDRDIWIPVERLFQGPGLSAVDPTRELITTLRFSLGDENGQIGTAWRRMGRREALILPILNCAVKLVIQEKSGKAAIQSAVLALGPGGSVPFRAREAEKYLLGKRPTSKTFQLAGEIARREAQPRNSPLRASREYRLAILPGLIQEALQEANQQIESIRQ